MNMSGSAESPENTPNDKPVGQRVTIKKYANRRLYNTASSTYVTLEHLSEMVKEGIDFVVFDAKTSEDITRSVLTQIIFEEESRGENLLPIQFLRQLIGFYGNSLQSVLPGYLELSLESFIKQQERFRTQMSTIAPATGLAATAAAYEEQVRQNMVLFNRAMSAFSPFAFPKAETAAPEPTVEPQKPASSGLDELREQLDAMRAQIDKLSSKD